MELGASELGTFSLDNDWTWVRLLVEEVDDSWEFDYETE